MQPLRPLLATTAHQQPLSHCWGAPLLGHLQQLAQCHQQQHHTHGAAQRPQHQQQQAHGQNLPRCSISSNRTSSLAGLLLRAGSALHEVWGSNTASSSRRRYSSRHVAAVPSANASAIMEELSRLREGDEAQVGWSGE